MYRNLQHKQCILKCKNGEHFFRFPNNPKTRNLWLKAVGLESATINTRLCDKHFSEDMFQPSGRRLLSTAFPDRNVPYLNVASNTECVLNYDSSIVMNDEPENVMMDGRSPKEIQNLIGNLLRKGDILTEYSRSKDVPNLNGIPLGRTVTARVGKIRSAVKNKTHATAKAKQKASKIIEARTNKNRDPSHALKNYQVRIQGEHVADVLEIPQFILVFTAFRARDTVIIPPADLEPQYNIQIADGYTDKSPYAEKHLQIDKLQGSNIFLQKEDLWREDKTFGPDKLPREIRYVPHQSQRINLYRDRAIQSTNVTGKTIAVQCDLEEESGTSHKGLQLEWINHMIEDHVFNAEGDIYECHICGEIAVSYASNLKHSMVHKESSSLCPKCGRLFSNHVKLKNHEKKAHQTPHLEIKTALRCPKFHCTKAFHSRRQLFNHIDEHINKTEQHKCNKCWRTFSSFLQFHCHKSRRNCLR